MKDGPEIERRWILGFMPTLYETYEYYDIVQVYGEDDLGRFRLRMQIGEDRRGTECFITRKKPISFGVSHEKEDPITLDDFYNRMESCKYGINKGRYVYPVGDLKYEVDVFKNHNLVLMELELGDITQQFSVPGFLSKTIITEITGIEAYSNFNLAKMLGERKFKMPKKYENRNASRSLLGHRFRKRLPRR